MRTEQMNQIYQDIDKTLLFRTALKESREY